MRSTLGSATIRLAVVAASFGVGSLVILDAHSEATPPVGVTVTMPGPARVHDAADRVQRNRECEECHADVAAQWRASLHHHAFDDPDFAAAFEREPRVFCQGCHAPEAPVDRLPAAELAAVGVSCMTCHVPPDAALAPGAVFAGPGPGAEPSPHPVVRTPRLATAEACGACHEFDSPSISGLAMQRTLQEHAQSAYAEQSCQDCHMPRVDGVAHHGFSASRDPQILRRAVVVEAQRPASDRVQIVLTPREVGHAFPTGDPFRRLVVEVWGQRRVLARRFGYRRRGLHDHRVEVADDRLGPEPVTLEFEGSFGRSVAWAVIYERADQALPGEEPEILGRVVLAKGRLR